jgi:hypothetical protein
MEPEATGTAELPPSLKESFDTLKTEGAAVASAPPETEKKKRGRKPGSKNRPKDGTEPSGVEQIVEFPIEALSLMHFEIWRYIAKRLKSEYKISEQGAKEMGLYASLCIKQYLGPYLAQHQALAAYLLTQTTALTICIVTREVKEKAIESKSELQGV